VRFIPLQLIRRAGQFLTGQPGFRAGLINVVSKTVNNDPDVGDLLKCGTWPLVSASAIATSREDD
jgi:hypothetical protein